ncbi:MAG: reductive dehalogenase [Spirochaetes bacterium]|nr:reductive dehalogenase [Spirochaetota bacterium]
MIHILIIIGAIGLAVQMVIGLSFFISCIIEKEKRAVIAASIQFIGMFILFGLYLIFIQEGFFDTTAGRTTLLVVYIITALFAFLLIRKTKANTKTILGTKGLITADDVKRFDERETVFARAGNLRPGTKQYEMFYAEHPEYKEFDDARRAKGVPMGHAGSIDQPYGNVNVAMMMACSSLPFYLSDKEKVQPAPHLSLEKELAKQKVAITPEEASERIKGFAKILGADLVGIAELNPLWVYSHRGRIVKDNMEDWGKEIPVAHRYAVVFAEEMKFDMIGSAPHTPTSIESMRNYAKGAFIAVQVASLVANLGYSATANHFRYYESLMVPLAVDAGLGELSRMGYLITREFGPRIRLSAVTTDLPLIPDKPVDIGVEDFCCICKKCAMCCPSGSIPDGDQVVVNGIYRWKLNAETCFAYWGKIGTDCNVCMRVCPWSHAQTFPHRLIKALTVRNALSRRLFNKMDDIFYGKKPAGKNVPKWATYKPWIQS